MTDALRDKLARIALACSDHTTTDALDKIVASIDRKEKRAAISAPPAVPLSDSQIAVIWRDECRAENKTTDLVRRFARAVLAASQPPAAMPAPTAQAELEAARWEGIQSVQAQTAVIVRAALELLDVAGDNFPPETLAAFRRVFGAQPESAQPAVIKQSLTTGAQPVPATGAQPKKKE